MQELEDGIAPRNTSFGGKEARLHQQFSIAPPDSTAQELLR